MGADRPDGGTTGATLVARTRTALRPGWLGGRLPLVVGGLLLWLGPGHRPGQPRLLLVPAPGAAGPRRTMSLHGTLGVWIALGLFLVSATGLTWSRYAGDNIGELRGALGRSNPTVSTLITSAKHGGTATGGEHHHTGSQARHAGAPIGANQLELAMLAVALTCLVAWGYVMWWQRRPSQDRRPSFGRHAPSGGSGTAAQA
jgi:uncharacterized iron-regulated membrane protein